jgi:hypothetical protein
MATPMELQLLGNIDRKIDYGNQYLSDISGFLSNIDDYFQSQSAGQQGTLNASATANQANTASTKSNLGGLGDDIAAVISKIVAAAGSDKAMRNVSVFLNDIGVGISDFVRVVREGNPVFQRNSMFLDDLIWGINRLAGGIQDYDKIDLKKKAVDLFAALGYSVGKLTDNLYSSAGKLRVGKLAITWIVDSINHLSEKVMNSKFIGKVGRSQMHGLGILTALGDGIYKFSDTLWSSAFKLRTGRIAIGWIISSVNTLTKGMVATDKTLTALGQLHLVGQSILKYAAYVALAAPLIAVSYLSIGLLAGSMALLSLAMGLIPDNMPQKAGLLSKAGVSILAFSATLALSSIVMGAVMTGPGALGLVMLLGTIAITGIMFKLIGDEFKSIGKGALGVALISLTMPLFAFSLLVSSAIMSAVGGMGVLALLGALAGTAMIFAIAGNFAMPIAMGALAFVTIGLSLMLLNVGLKSILETVANKSVWDLLGTAGIIGGLAAVFALAGAAIELIAPGAVALGLMGGALWVIGKGVGAIMASNPDVGKSKAFAASMSAMLGIFSGISITDALLIPLKLPGLLSLALGMTTLAAGVKSWQNLSINKEDIQGIADKISSILTVIPNVFASIGASDRGSGGKKSIFGVIFGGDFVKGDVERGISSTLKLGSNLKNLADGIIAWKTMSITPADIETIKTNITSVLSAIPQVFASMGKVDNNGESSWLKTVIGTDFTKGNIERGIASTRDLGKTLTDISNGVKAWLPNGKEGITPILIDNIKRNITDLLILLPETFANIGKRDEDSAGWFSDGDIKQGIDLVTNLMPTLKRVADFIIGFKGVDVGGQGVIIGGAMNQIFDSIIVFMKKLDTAKNSDDFVDIFDRIVSNFGKFASNVDKANRFMTKFTTYTDPMTKLAFAFERITFSIERQVKAINSIVNGNMETYTNMLTGLNNLGNNSNLASIERNVNYTLGSGFTPEQALMPAVIGRPQPPQAITPNNDRQVKQLANQGENALLAQILQELRIQQNTPPPIIDAASLGVQIAHAIVDYFQQQKFKF